MSIQGKTMQTKTALVVDDSRVARLTLSKLLQAQGFDIVEQGSGEEALAWLQQPGHEPTIIFMDVMMPGMDGLTATRQIKAIPAVSSIPVIVCTGKDSEADLAQARESGAAAVLSKPPAAEALSSILASVSSTKESVEAAEPEPEENNKPDINLDDLIAAVRQQLLPELEQKVISSVAVVQRQVETKLAEQPSLPGLDALSEMTDEVKNTVQHHISELTQSLSSQAEQVVSSTADKAFEAAVENFGLRDKLTVMLHSEGEDWLAEQQTELKATLQTDLKEALLTLLETKLDEQLNNRMPELFKNENEGLLKQFFGEQIDEIAKLKAQMNQQRQFALAAVVVAVAALIFAFV